MFSVLRLFTHLPVQLLICLVLGLFFGTAVSPDFANILYTASCLIKDMLMYALPFVIFTYLWAALCAFGNSGLIMVLLTFLFIVVANAFSLLTAYGFGTLLLPSIVDGKLTQLNVTETTPVIALWNIPEMPFLKPVYGLSLGLFVGTVTIVLKHIKSSSASEWAHTLHTNSIKLRDLATNILKKGFIPFLPLYVLGFVVKLARDGHLTNLMHGYAHTFLFGCALIIGYLVFWYAVGSSFSLSGTIASIREMLPAGITGLTTMSSSATMPVTLDATEKNIHDREYADFIIPTSVNSHLPGDGINITLTAMALLLMSGRPLPTLGAFLIYMCHYCLIKFSAAGVPGGGVIVILPVVRDYLGLDETATTLLATIYILQDPILTSANVMGNGAFAMVTHRILKPFLKKDKEFEAQA